ncbi:MAG: hypothetical protein IJT36_03295 [Alphaproteobacteria bacterium]|nr:hypothetical protein [Alphaproteobacteria bacterium]
MNIDKLLLEMTDVVKENVKRYITDFYIYDTANLASIMRNSSFFISRVDLVWIVRENGTFLCDSIDTNKIKQIIYQFGDIKGYYRIIKSKVSDSWGIRAITKEEAVQGVRYADVKKSIYWNDAVCVVLVHPDGHTEEIKKTGGYAGDSVLYNDFVIGEEFDKEGKFIVFF